MDTPSKTKKTVTLGIRATVEQRKELKQYVLDHVTSVQALFESVIYPYIRAGNSNIRPADKKEE